jgi:hypothetical protein
VAWLILVPGLVLQGVTGSGEILLEGGNSVLILKDCLLPVTGCRPARLSFWNLR